MQPPDTQVALRESPRLHALFWRTAVLLTPPQLLAELHAGGVVPDRDVPPRELNRPRSGTRATAGTPVIDEALFRRLE